MATLFAQVEPSTNLMPAGPHTAKLIDAEWTTSKAGDPMIKARLVVVSDGARGKARNVYLSFGEKAAPITFRNLLAIRPDMTKQDWQAYVFPEGETDHEGVARLQEDLLGYEFDIVVRHKPSTRTPGETEDDIAGYYPRGSKTGAATGGSW
jgi:hypothetical protein